MKVAQEPSELLAAFPINETEIILICPHAVNSSMGETRLYHLESGLLVKEGELNAKRPERILLRVERMTTQSLPLTE
jgi:hypothetical protein